MPYYNDTYGTYYGDDVYSNVNDGTSGNDSISMSVSGTVRAYSGNDTINVKSKNVYASGGSDDDLFIINAYYSSKDLTDITITSGSGKDTIEFRPDNDLSHYTDLGIIITDFSKRDVIRLDSWKYSYSGDNSRRLTQTVESGNVVISDNVSIGSSSEDSVNVEPSFSITLQGISDISKVADAMYYHCSPYGDIYESKTLGELFQEDSSTTTVTAVDTVQSSSPTITTSGGESTTPTVTTSDGESTTSTVTTASSESTTPTVTTASSESTTPTVITSGGKTDTIPAPVTISGGIGSTVPTVLTYGKTTATVAATVTTAGGDSNDTVLVVDSSFVGGGGGDTIIQGPVIVDSSVEGGIGNTYYVTVNVGTLEINNNYYTYEGGYRFLQDYTQGQVIKLSSDYTGIDLFGDHFIVKSSTGQLEIQNARDKYISYSGDDERVVAYSYVSSDEGNIEGAATWYSQADILIGADNKDNKITGGYGSSSLWGGNGQRGDDTLIGGSGHNEFFYTVGNGHDVIKNTSYTDLINFVNVNLSQITSAEVSSDEVVIRFTDGGDLRVVGNNSNLSYRINEGTYTCNQSTGEWFQK